MPTVIKCPECGSTADAGVNTITEGAFPWRCKGCNNEWELHAVFFKVRDNYDPKRFRKTLAQAMKARGINQQQLARMAGVTAAYISLILAGKRVPPLPTAQRILEALGEHDAADAL